MMTINCRGRENYSKLLYMSEKIYLIPGENIIKTSILINYILTLTEYRLYLIYENTEPSRPSDDELCHVSIPLGLILKIEPFQFNHFRILTKIGGLHLLSFDSSENCSLWLQLISDVLFPSTTMKPFALKFFKYMKCISSSMLKSGSSDKKLYTAYDLYIVQKEFDRMKFDKSWKITDVNIDFKICSSYPRFHIVPASITNDEICAMAEFRGNKRFPSVVWRSQMNGTVLIRCAQPQVGLMFWRNASDETFFKEVIKCLNNVETVNVKKLLIIDARHYSTAQFNRIRGGGVEFSGYYGEAEIMFMQLENIHSVRNSFDLISLFTVNSEAWLTNLENSYWLKNLSKLLKSAYDIARALNDDGRSVIIHCSDGWDRTPQLTSLVQILLDGYYRSIKGIQVLIEKEWLQFGHKFSDRCASNKSMDYKERSPVFVQWLDCVHQLIKQYPKHFEFNETFLIKLAIHIHSGLFGNFLYNTEEERIQNDISNSTISIWNFLTEKNDTITNPLYYKNFNSKETQFFEGVIYPKYNTKFILPWNKLFFEALNPLNSYNIFTIDYSTSKPLSNSQNNYSKNSTEETISSVPLSMKVSSLRKSKSEADLINIILVDQTLSSSSMNVSVHNCFSNENRNLYFNKEIQQKATNTNNYAISENMVLSNGIINGVSHQEAKKTNNGNNNNNNPKESSSKYNNNSLTICQNNKGACVSTATVPSDFDGLYLSKEPINQLAKQWGDSSNVQKSTIEYLKKQLNLKNQNINKVRTDLNEKNQKEGSISSYDSFIISGLEIATRNHCLKFGNGHVEKSKLEIENGRESISDSSDHCYKDALITDDGLRRSSNNDTLCSEGDETSSNDLE